MFSRSLEKVKIIWTAILFMFNRGDDCSDVIEKIFNLIKSEGIKGIKYRLGIISGNDYTNWIYRYDRLLDQDRLAMRQQATLFEVRPLISIVMPVYNPDPQWLISAIESVFTQIYTNWQLCIADDASTDSAVREVLESYIQKDPRVRVTFRPENGHISEASNSALALASGEWIALLDHDDLLSEHALYWVVDAINNHPSAQLFYSDEDKIDKNGNRWGAYFKCDWNPELFNSQNMISHLGVYKAQLVNQIGGFRQGFEGSQDYDLALRFIERISADQIIHIPKVLYHWRAHEFSTASANDVKPYALTAGERALNEHFQRLRINATAALLDFGMYRVKYELPEQLPLVSLIIPTRNALELIQRCIESIIDKTTYTNYEILIIDNGSDDLSALKYLQSFSDNPRIRVIRDDRPFNFSALNNNAVKQTRGELVGLINNDIEVISPDWLSEMVSLALRPEVGAVGAKLWYPNDTLQHGGVILGLGGVAGHQNRGLPAGHKGYFGRASVLQSFSAVTAACLVVRKSLYEKAGGFDVELEVAFNDVDFCLKLRNSGYRNVWTPFAELYHHESATRGLDDLPEKQDRFNKEVALMKAKWNHLLIHDPAYNPNLSLEYGDYRVAWPPRGYP